MGKEKKITSGPTIIFIIHARTHAHAHTHTRTHTRTHTHTHTNAHTKFDILANYYQLSILLSLIIRH